MRRYIFKIILLLIAILFNSCIITKNAEDISFHTNNFNQEQIDLIMSGDSLKPMRVFEIDKFTDSILLRTKCENVNVNSEDVVLLNLIKRMYSTVNDSLSAGVGIAAPQVGILKNIILVQRFDKENEPFEVYLNPRIIQYSKQTQTRREGCLSIPDRMDTLDVRAYTILLEYDRLDNTHIIEMVEGFTAIIFQHEIDHLNGILYTDYVAKKK